MIAHLLIWSCKDCTHEYTFGLIDVVLIYMHFHSDYNQFSARNDVTFELTTIQSRVGENETGSYTVVENQL